MRLSTEIYTSKVDECKDFYLKYFDFKVKSRAEGFVVLQNRTNPEYELMFCVTNSPFVNAIFHLEYNNKGVILQFEVDNVINEYHRIKSLGIPILIELVEEPINGNHFTISDPSGLLIDIVSY
ncbi:VOC family protein [Flavobacteriaceae bacterium TK19130]|nr:VOC family protein [Thermobacterium salinum]